MVNTSGRKLFVAGIGGFAAWCTTILFNVLINAISPVRIPLWSTTILALMLVTYWFTGSAEDRIENKLRRKPKIAGFTEDPNFPVDDPSRNKSQQFYTLRAANRWMLEQEAKGAINGSFKHVHGSDERILYPAPYTSTRVKLTIAYMLTVVIIALAVQWFIETAYPDKELGRSDAYREVYRRFPFWASMILTWVLLAHAELRELATRES